MCVSVMALDKPEIVGNDRIQFILDALPVQSLWTKQSPPLNVIVQFSFCYYQ